MRYPEQLLAVKATKNLPKKLSHIKHHWSYKKENWLDIIYLLKHYHCKLHSLMFYDPHYMQYRLKTTGELLYKKDHIRIISNLEDYVLRYEAYLKNKKIVDRDLLKKKEIEMNVFNVEDKQEFIKCNRCKKEKTPNNFNRNKFNPKLYKFICKECESKLFIK